LFARLQAGCATGAAKGGYSETEGEAEGGMRRRKRYRESRVKIQLPEFRIEVSGQSAYEIGHAAAAAALRAWVEGYKQREVAIQRWADDGGPATDPADGTEAMP
jgi:hypothetical protein